MQYSIDDTAAGSGKMFLIYIMVGQHSIETTKWLVRRIKRYDHNDPIHYGTFLSGDQRIRSSEMRYLHPYCTVWSISG